MATAPEPWRPGGPARPGAGAKATSSSIDGAALVGRLRELASSSELPLDALEQSLRAVLDASGAAAGAICLYDTRQELLRLAAEQGLSDEGCRRLRTVRRGDAGGWDMPLHGLLNRRAYLIDSAARNRYVPPLVESATVRTIACLPLLQGNTAQGSLVLVMVSPGTLREDDIRALDQPMRELARLIDVVRRQVSGEAVTSREIASGVPAAPAARPLETPGSDQADSGRIAALTIALTAARREKARLEADNERLRSEGARHDPRLADLAAEVDRLRTRLAEAEAGAAHEQRAREEIQAALQRGSSVDQNELREAIEAARRAETMRGGLLAENARLVSELERLRGGEGPATSTADLAEEVDRLRARLAEAEAGAAHEHRVREELEAALQRGASLGQHELRDALEAAQRAEAARTGLLVENARLVTELEQLRGSEGGATHQAPEVGAEIDRLRARLAESEAGAAHEHRVREALEATLQRDANSTVRELREAHEAARHAQAAHAHVASDNARLEAELEWARHEAERIAPLLASLAQAEQERAQLAAAFEAARAERANEQRAGAVREATSAAETTTTIERLQAKLAEAEEMIARERRAHEAQAQAAGDAAAQNEQLQEARAHAAAVEASRDSAMLELTVARGSLSRAESMLHAAQEEATRTLDELNRVRAEEVALRGERDLIAYDLEALRAREQELGARLAERGREIEALQQERAAEAVRAEQAGVEADGLRQSIAELELERRRLGAEVEGAAAARARLEEALEQGLAQARGRDQDLGAQLSERALELEALRVERAADAARVEQLGSEADRLRQGIADLELERGRLTAEIEGAAAGRARLEAALEEGLAEARGREQDIAARLAERERELEALRADRVAGAERVEQLGAEADRLRQGGAELELERGRLAAEVEGAAAARARLEESLEQSLAQARAREQELEARLATREQELEARLAAREQELEASVRERERALEALAAEPIAPEAGTAAAGAADGEPSDAEVRAALAALAAGPLAPAREPVPAASPTTPVAEAAAPAAVTPPPAPKPPAALAAAPEPAASVGDASLTVVLDADPRWEKSAGAKQKVVAVGIDGDTQGRLTKLGPARIVANLTIAKTLDALVALREAGSRARVWGCMADSAAGRGLLLGVVEPAARPLDPNAILAHLEQYGMKGARVLTVGDDVDAFISLRQALTRGGMSVSMAWNGKQAVDLLPMVRPHLVVLDLGVAAGDAAPVLALIAATKPSPITVLVPGTKDAAPTFAQALKGAGAPASLAQVLTQLRDPSMS